MSFPDLLRVVRVLLSAVSALLFTLPAEAQTTGSARLGVSSVLERDTNPTLVTVSPQATTRLTVIPSVDWTIGSVDTLSLGASTRLEHDQRSGESRADPHLQVKWKSERAITEWAASAIYDRAPNRTLVARDSSLQGQGGARTSRALSGTLRREMDPLTSGQVSATHEHANFDTVSVPDYSVTSAFASVDRRVSERVRWSVKFDAQSYDPEQIPGQTQPPGATRSSGLVAGYTSNARQDLDLELEAGMAHFYGRAAAPQGSATVRVFGNRSEVSVRLSRRPAVAAGSGSLTFTTSAAVRWRYELAERWSVGAEYSRGAASTPRSASTLRALTTTYEVAPRWRLAGALHDRSATRFGQTGRANGRLASVTLEFLMQ